MTESKWPTASRRETDSRGNPSGQDHRPRDPRAGHVTARATPAPRCRGTPRSHVGGVARPGRGRGEGPCVVRAAPRPSPLGARMQSNAITAGAADSTRRPGLDTGRAAP